MHNKDQSELVKRIKSFQFAFEGWAYVLKTQKNARIHSFFTLSVLLCGLWLGLSRFDWTLILLVIALVWMAEFINTAIEAIVDMTMPNPHALAKVAKDVSAGAVLLVAFTAILTGLLILGPPLWARIFG